MICAYHHPMVHEPFPFEQLLAAWAALKLTLGILPGAILVAWAGNAGLRSSRPRLSLLVRDLAEAQRAKYEALGESVIPIRRRSF